MSNWLSNLFPYNKIRTLEQEIVDLKAKVQEKQEVINKTNAYYKRELRKLQNPTSSVYRAGSK